MGVIITKRMIVRRVAIRSASWTRKGNRRSTGIRGIDMVVAIEGTRSTLSVTTIGEYGQGQGANQGMMVMMIIQGGGANFALQAEQMVIETLGNTLFY
jgi:hypothetical protein